MRTPSHREAWGTAEEQAFVDKINALRTSKGLRPLRVDAELTEQARAWAVTMRGQGRIFHAKSLEVGITADWKQLGENVGVGGDVGALFRSSRARPTTTTSSSRSTSPSGSGWWDPATACSPHTGSWPEINPPQPPPTPPPTTVPVTAATTTSTTTVPDTVPSELAFGEADPVAQFRRRHPSRSPRPNNSPECSTPSARSCPTELLDLLPKYSPTCSPAAPARGTHSPYSPAHWPHSPPPPIPQPE